MKYAALREMAYEANMALARSGLVIMTWGNVSQADREAGMFAIKPSGVAYDKLRPEDIVVLDFDGNLVEGALRPSSDAPTHAICLREMAIGGMVHTHSTYATAFAQAGRGIDCMGTTHADTFFGQVPCAPPLTDAQINGDYERETGASLLEAFVGRDVRHTPAVLAHGHGPFAFGGDAIKAVENAIVLEEVARMAWLTLGINPAAQLGQAQMNKHFYRKHGPGATYGQGVGHE